MELENDISIPNSSSSSNSSLPLTLISLQSPKSRTDLPLTSLKRKFNEVTHPVYRGVRRKNGKKWVCEVREPKKKTRIWLGTFPTPEMAARAYDVATLAFHGEYSVLNFPDSSWRLPRPCSSSARDIQVAAFQAAEAFKPSATNCDDIAIDEGDSSSLGVDVNVSIGEAESGADDYLRSTFVDEEAFFNMPGFINSMAEGLLLTPPAMKKGFCWDDVGDNYAIDLTLWNH